MNYLVLLTLALVGTTLAFEIKAKKTVSYHQEVGIPLAKEIKALEESTEFSGNKIVGGQYTGLGEFPFYGGLLTRLNSGDLSVCGCTLVSNTKALTAAHCWTDGTQAFTGQYLDVVFASTKLFSGGVRIRSSQVEVHANYNPNTLDNDIAMITIPRIEYTNLIQPVTLPSGFLLYLTFAGNWAEAVGFGRTYDGQQLGDQTLKHTSMQVIPNLECAAVYGFGITDSMLCTSTLQFTSTCSGDSGGPLTASLSGDRVLIGITSFTSAGGCSRGFPAGFTRVTSFIHWINARL